MLRLLALVFCTLLWNASRPVANKPLFALTKGKITFSSDAFLEYITASSQQIRGVIDPSDQKFAFSVGMISFEGFNSPLQKEHFNENFMESKTYRNATFSGKIIEKIDFDKEGEYTIRAKGTLSIHGIKRERIIKSNIRIKEGKIYVKSVFFVHLKEHDIKIPRIVHQKIAKEILVKVDVVFEKKDKI